MRHTSALATISLTANEAQVFAPSSLYSSRLFFEYAERICRVLIAHKDASARGAEGGDAPRKPQDNNPLTFCHSTWAKTARQPTWVASNRAVSESPFPSLSFLLLAAPKAVALHSKWAPFFRPLSVAASAASAAAVPAVVALHQPSTAAAAKTTEERANYEG